jgi:hypothetical protein
MSYGFELTNKDGEVLLNTDEPYPLLVPGTVTTATGYGVEVPSVGTGEILFARPNNNESGVISTTTIVDDTNNTSTNNFLGTSAEEQYWGAADGVNHVKVKKVSEVITTPSNTGYGFECYDTSGNVLFSTNMSGIMRVEAIAALSFGEALTFDNPSGEDFNDLYVSVLGMSTFVDKDNVFNSGFFGLHVPDIISGFYAHFDDTNERITFAAQGAFNTTSNSGPQWDTFANARNFFGFAVGYSLTSQPPYLAIVGRIV